MTQILIPVAPGRYRHARPDELPVTRHEAGGVRHLLYHVYPLAADSGAAWRWNVAKLKRRLSLFNGRRVVGIAVGPETEPAASVRAALAGCGCEFLERPNDSTLREGTTFHALHERVAEFTGPEHVTLYAHAKGITSANVGGSDAGGSRPWAEALYETCLDHWPAVRRALRDFPLAGPFKRTGFCFDEMPSIGWHYSGSWRWFRNADFFTRDWRRIERVWTGVEGHPGLHFQSWEAASLCHEITVHGLALYLNSYWRNTVRPTLDLWRDEHLADRYTPALLTCVLTSHAKPKYVHEAIASVQAQTAPDWQLIVMDSGLLAAEGEFDRYRSDPRITIVVSGETEEQRHMLGIQAWCINECHRRGLVQGDLVCYLCDDDVYDPGIFAAWLAAARLCPNQSAWYGPADRTEIRNGVEVKVGELRLYPNGVSLDCKADGMQVCHRRAATMPWPESKPDAWHADGLWLAALGQATLIHPLAAPVGRHRHTADSTFTKPAAI